MMSKREKTKRLYVGSVPVGGGAAISVQSMCTTKTPDVEGTLSQIRALSAAGCEIIRLAVPDMEAARALSQICEISPLPVVADIHFDYRLALEAASRGVGAIRINPGNIGGEENVRAVARACRERGIPIRIGVNSGSIEGHILGKYGHPTPEGMVESAAYHAALLEKFDFDDICISLKASSARMTVAAYRLAAERFTYPLHLGVTETGTAFRGAIHSAVGIGTLLNEGIGDTIRVSLTADPAQEVKAGLEILRACGLRKGGLRLISCPTCGRTEIDLIALAHEVEGRLEGLNRDITVAVMGCVVNGPGEAREADYGIAGGRGCGLLFKKGEVLGTFPYGELCGRLVELIESEAAE